MRAASSRRQCVHGAVRFVTAQTRSVSALSANYGHPEPSGEGSFVPAASGRRQFVHGAVRFVTAQTRSVSVLSTDYGHPERVKRVEGSFDRRTTGRPPGACFLATEQESKQRSRLKGDTLSACSRTQLRFPLKKPLSAL